MLNKNTVRIIVQASQKIGRNRARSRQKSVLFGVENLGYKICEYGNQLKEEKTELVIELKPMVSLNFLKASLCATRQKANSLPKLSGKARGVRQCLKGISGSKRIMKDWKDFNKLKKIILCRAHSGRDRDNMVPTGRI